MKRKTLYLGVLSSVMAALVIFISSQYYFAGQEKQSAEYIDLEELAAESMYGGNY